jgi:predicted alpha/beta superfamily hydrolase
MTELTAAALLDVSSSRQTTSVPARAPVVRANAEQWDMRSSVTGRTYRIYVAKPVATVPPPAEGYPVIYLNDGDFMFHTAADTLTMQSIGREAEPAYIVGIGYGKDWETAARTRCADLTPCPPDAANLAALEASPFMKGAIYGEAEGFHRFMTEELRPQIEAAYSVDRNNNILWGDSFGGLFALHVLFNHPEAYRTYLVGSPSINWSAGAILNDEAKLIAPLAAGKVAPRVFFTVGELEEKLADHVQMHPGVTREQMQAMLTAFGMVTNALALADRLKRLAAPAGCEVEAVVFPDETHLSIIPAAISRGLRFALARE